MAKKIVIDEIACVDGKTWIARGSCDGKVFSAKTIIYDGEPIFKVQEPALNGGSSHFSMNESTFGRGERIAIARHLKKARLAYPALVDDLGQVNISDDSEGDSENVIDLSVLTVPDLRARCKELGISGYHAKGVRRGDLVHLIESAA